MKVRKGIASYKLPAHSAIVGVTVDLDGEKPPYRLVIQPIHIIERSRKQSPAASANPIYGGISAMDTLELFPSPKTDCDMQVRYTPPEKVC